MLGLFFSRFTIGLCVCTEYCEKYAKPEDIGAVAEEKSSDEELSEDDYSSADEDMAAGQADD